MTALLLESLVIITFARKAIQGKRFPHNGIFETNSSFFMTLLMSLVILKKKKKSLGPHDENIFLGSLTLGPKDSIVVKDLSNETTKEVNNKKSSL